MRMNKEKGTFHYEDMKEMISLKSLRNVCFNEKNIKKNYLS